MQIKEMIGRAYSRLHKSLDIVLGILLIRKREERRIEDRLLSDYTKESNVSMSAEEDAPTLIYMADGRILHGGLADRLRAMVSLYSFCKDHGYSFKIHFTSPFNLIDYLLPNEYDWTIADENILRTYPLSKPIFIDTKTWPTRLEEAYQLAQLKKKVKFGCKQLHVYTNCFFGNDKFGELFYELFQLQPQLCHQLEKNLKFLGQNYISVSTRFLNSLGDFNETMESPVLSNVEKDHLIESCYGEIISIMNEHPGLNILVTSDSTTFLSKVKSIGRCYIIEGDVSHIDNSNYDANANVKTFLDFFMISKAMESYLIVGPHMHNSNFSKRAAALNNRCVHVRVIQ